MDLGNSKQMQILQWFLLFAIIGLVVRLAFKFGLLGKSDTEKGAEDFKNNPLGSGNTVEVPQSIVKAVAATAKKPAEKVTKEDVKKYMPSAGLMTNWLNSLKDAMGTFDDDEEKVYNVFRQMKNQIAFYSFTQFFTVYMKKNLIDWLAANMNDSELSHVNDIIKKLPQL